MQRSNKVIATILRCKTRAQKFLSRKAKLLRRWLMKLPPAGRLGVVFGTPAVVIAAVVLLIVLPGGDKPASASIDPNTALMPFGAESAMATPAQLIDVSTPVPATPAPTPTPVPTPTPTPDPTLKRGMESDAVMELQQQLIKLGYLELEEPTKFFGPATEDAVKLFQRQVAFVTQTEFAQDGIAGVQTLNLIYSDDAPKYVVREGMEGEDITIMQSQLVDLGYMKKTTGYYGTETITAIKDFQDRNGLSSDGLAGEKTVDLLYSPDARESATKAQEARRKANISTMIEVAKKKIGCSYIRGNTGPNSFDCSGLVYYCLKQAGSNRRRLNAAGYSQVSDWDKITSMNDLKRGDLIFFYDNNFTKVGHVGICMGGGEMIDASSKNGKVMRRSIWDSYWKKHFVCGRRPW